MRIIWVVRLSRPGGAVHQHSKSYTVFQLNMLTTHWKNQKQHGWYLFNALLEQILNISILNITLVLKTSCFFYGYIAERRSTYG